ncbi:FecR domain-containing protein [Paraflavitalea sp. CAU 1676]|uniref:FecR family protein n=1 Tax=Paraflavitalea sp. CAU 1676 TaxID=3032598 RepID=UPI0023DA0550|nr:FecR domain-containing protein [Paraflavitalea sp. CAU 1676]MDF2192444.1 FecR domain-containing protein [Paraflavitalea sp. CAU 1676]
MSDYQHYSAADFLADESFVNYLLQQNEADTAMWKERLATGQVQQAELQRATELFFALRTQKAIPVDKQAEQEKLRQLITSHSAAQRDTGGNTISITRRRSVALRYAWPAAAAVLLILGATWYLMKAGKRPTNAKDFVAFAATKKDIQRVTLPDGSEVILNGNSSISLAPGFNKDKREILLTGTAFFEVARNPEKPFTVISGKVSTTALGTSFYIHQSSNAAPTTVSLLTGKVLVEVEGQPSVHLVPYEQGVYHHEQELVKSTYDKDMLINWTKGMVVFNNANWVQVKNIIEEYFDKKLVIDNYKKDISFTGAFKADQLESILSSLEFTYDLKYTINNQTVNIAF